MWMVTKEISRPVDENVAEERVLRRSFISRTPAILTYLMEADSMGEDSVILLDGVQYRAAKLTLTYYTFREWLDEVFKKEGKPDRSYSKVYRA